MTCLFVLQGAYAIDISFSGSNGGGTVGIAGSYDVDDSVGVSGKASASFDGGVSMTDSQSLSGSGDADIRQVMYGSGGGADYVINYALETLGASTIEGSGSSALTPVAGSASRSVSTTGTSLMTSELSGVQGGDFAGVWSFGQFAGVSTTQKVATGESVAASQSLSAEGSFVVAQGRAIDAYGSWVETNVVMSNGRVVADQEVEAGNSAFASQTVELEGVQGGAWSKAEDEEGNKALTDSFVKNGNFTTGQYVAADDGAFVSQTTVVEGEYGWADSNAEDDEGNYVSTWAAIEKNGILEADQMAWAGEDWWFDDEGAVASQHTFIEADRGVIISDARDDDGNAARTEASMTNGTLETVQDVWAGEDWGDDYEGTEAYQDTFIEADRGNAYSEAWDADRNAARTEVSMTNGTLETLQGAWAVEDWGDNFEVFQAYQSTFIEADHGTATSLARDDDGNFANTSASMTNGTLLTYQGVWAVEDWGDDYEGAEAYQNTLIEADRGTASSSALDDDGNFANTSASMTNGTLLTYQGAWAVEDRGDNFEGVRASQWTMIIAENGSAESYAEDANGSYVDIFAIVENGSLQTNQWAEAVNSAGGYQNTDIVGEFAYAFCEANNTGKNYSAYVDNWVNGSASLEFEGNASVNASEARAHQVSHAEGDRIWPWANSTNDHDENDTTGSHDFESWAWTNETGEYAHVELII